MISTEKDKETLDYVYDKVLELIMRNWDMHHGEGEYANGKDMAYRDVLGILTSILNK